MRDVDPPPQHPAQNPAQNPAEHPAIRGDQLATPYAVFVLSVLLAALLGWLLHMGQAIMLPIFAAVISVYVLVSASEAMARVPVLGRLPAFARRAIVLLAFGGVLLALLGVVVTTVNLLIAAAPTYQVNLERLIGQISETFGLASAPDWQSIRAATLDRIQVMPLINAVLVELGSLGGSVVLVIVYAGFLMSERAGFHRKLLAALPKREHAERAEAIVESVNERIGDYLAIKTLVNAILGAISFAVLWAMGIDFPVFWALFIGLLNYIPYFGSLVGVAFPVALSALQFGQWSVTLGLAAMLTAAQAFVGNVLEPRVIGNRVNLSPFVVLVALSFWSAIWGLAGAILAVPLTSILAIVFSAFAPTRPFAVLLSEDVHAAEHDAIAEDEAAHPRHRAGRGA